MASDDSFLPILIGVVFVGAISIPCMSNMYTAAADRHHVTGDVAVPVTGKMRISGGSDSVSGSEKYAVTLKTNGGLGVYNCTSTQCSGLVVGSRVTLSCFEEWHVFTPDEEECRFERLVSVPTTDI